MHIVSTSTPNIKFIPRTDISGDLILIPLTADTTLYTADTTLITADATQIEQAQSYNAEIIDEQSKAVTTIAALINTSGNYQQAALSFTPILERFYTIRIYDVAGNDIYRGKLFCTNQTDFDKYTVHQGTYTPNVTTNQFTIINE